MKPSSAVVEIQERVHWLKKFQKVLFKNRKRILETICAETDKSEIDAISTELIPVLLTAKYYRKKAAKFLAPRPAKSHWIFRNKKTVVRHLPYGTVGIIGPANLPFVLTIGDAIPALMAGNSVVIKPSEKTPESARLGVELAQRAGLLAGLLQIMEGGPEAANQLIETVDCIFFTGSTAVGKKIAARAGELLKPCILELGGKAPMIVLEDADLERAANACVWGKFVHSGQQCIAIERVYVHQSIAETFINKVVQRACTLSIPFHTTPHIEELLQDAVQKGAQIAWQSPTEAKATILVNVNHTMRVMQEEAFGPLLPMMTVSSPEEAVQLANDSSFGLGASIFTENTEEGFRLAQKIEAGSVVINDCLDQFAIIDAPFAGWKQSGVGLRHSKEGLLQFTRPQTIVTHLWSWPLCQKRELWWYPYTRKTRWLLNLLSCLFSH